MRFNTKIFLIFAAIIVLFNSCKNDLNILAPYRETVSVYALLNPTDKRQYVRINKIYLGEGNAYTMATVHDSVNYPSGVLQVSLTRTYFGAPALTTKGNSTKTEIFLTDTLVQISPGPFNSTQRLWFTDDLLYPDGDYHLKIKNTVTGNEFTSNAVMFDSILQPNTSQPLGSPYYPVAYSPSNPSWYYLDLSVPTLPRKIKFSTVANARDYSCTMRFNYVDSISTGVGTKTVAMSVDYTFPTLSSNDLKGGEQKEFNYTSRDFFNYIYGEITTKGDPAGLLFRRIVNIDFAVTAGSQDFSDFLKISAPSTSVAQDKPAYTNIEGGGFGIFSCRSVYYKRKHLANATIDYLATTKPYCNLRFITSLGSTSAPCN